MHVSNSVLNRFPLSQCFPASPRFDGINVRKGAITNMLEESVVQPLLVTTSALTLASECVRMILKIDDIVSPGRRSEASHWKRKVLIMGEF